MTIEEVKEWLLSDMRKGISDVINGESEFYDNKFLSPWHAIEFLRENGAKDLNKFDSNGWAHDNWSYYEINNKKYCISGAGYYGGIRFELSDDNDKEELDENIEDIKPWE